LKQPNRTAASDAEAGRSHRAGGNLQGCRAADPAWQAPGDPGAILPGMV